LIEGTRNSENFACPEWDTTCALPLLEGQNDFVFWAHSTYGDTSYQSTASGKLDSQPPTLNGQVSGVEGENGWYVSDVTLSLVSTTLRQAQGRRR